MTAHTKHLSDQERDTFTACGLVVIDSEADPATFSSFGGAWVAPEGWRILTEPCPTYGETHIGSPMTFDKRGHNVPGGTGACELDPPCVRGRRVVTLTATCPTCDGEGETIGQGGTYMCEHCDGSGVVTLGRFTIPSLLPFDGTLTIDLRLGDLRPGQFIARPEPVPI